MLTKKISLEPRIFGSKKKRNPKKNSEVIAMELNKLDTKLLFCPNSYSDQKNFGHFQFLDRTNFYPKIIFDSNFLDAKYCTQNFF